MKARPRPDDIPKGFTKRGNKYWTRVPGDAKREVGHPDLTALVKWKAAHKHALINNEPLPPAPGMPGFGQPRGGLSFRQYATDIFLTWYRTKGNLTATTSATEKRLTQIADYAWTAWPITSIREETLRAWAEEIQQSKPPSTTKRMLELVWGVFDRAAKDPDVPLTGNPASDIRPPVDRGARRGQLKQPKRGVLELEHVAALAARMHAQYLLPFGMQFVSGLRVGEGFGAAVGSYTPARDNSELGWLGVVRQFSETTYPVDDTGYRTRFAPWVKTEASYRLIPVGPALDTAFRESVMRNYGHDFGDPWWDEPCADPWDPAIVFNRDLPLVCPPAGADVIATRIPHYREQLVQAAVELGIDLRWGPGDRRGPLIPHDLRKAFSTHLLDAGADRAGRSVYLGHKHAAAWDEAGMTAAVYSPETRLRLSRIAALAEKVLVPVVGSLIPVPPLTGDEALVTVAEGWEALGHPFSDATMRSYVARAKLQQHPNPWKRKGVYYRLGDIRVMIDRLKGPDFVPAAECAALLFPDCARQTGLMKLAREVEFGNVVRARRGYYERKSVDQLRTQFDAIETLKMIPVAEFSAATGQSPDAAGVTVFRCSLGAFVPAAAVPDAVGLQPVPHDVAAASLGLDQQAYWAALHAHNPEQGLELALDQSSSLPARLLRRLREQLAAGVIDPAPPTLAAITPDASWMTWSDGCYQLGVDAGRLEQLALRMCWRRGIFCGEVYLLRRDIEFARAARDAVTLPALAHTLGVDVQRAERLAAESEWLLGGDGPVALYSLSAVRRSLTRMMLGPHPTLVTVSDAARWLSCGRRAVQHRIDTGELDVYVAPLGTLLVRRSPRVALLKADQVRALQHTVPDGYVRLSDAAQQCGVNLSTVRTWAGRPGSPAVRDTSGARYVNPADVRDAFAREIPEGWLHIRDVVVGTGYDTRALRNRLTRLAREDKVLGRKTGMPLAWYFPPKTRHQLTDILGDIGTKSPLGQAS